MEIDCNSTINVQGAYVLSFCMLKHLHKEFRSQDTCSYIFFTYVQGVYINATCTDDGTVHVLDSLDLEIMVLKRLIFITFII